MTLFEKTKPIYWFIVSSSWFIAKTRKSYLKKQSQFVPARIGIKPYSQRRYGNKPPFGARKNKPNSKPISISGIDDERLLI